MTVSTCRDLTAWAKTAGAWATADVIVTGGMWGTPDITSVVEEDDSDQEMSLDNLSDTTVAASKGFQIVR